jgi:beta-lactamase class A
VASLAEQIAAIDRDTPGDLGVYVKSLATGEAMSHGGDRWWYLGSTAKVAIAIAVLQDVDAGRIRLADRVALTEGDRTEASQVVWQPIGTRHTVEQLLTKMLWDSDNTAANMLVRTVGVDRLNASAERAMGEGFEAFTDFASVRREVYTILHPDAARLTNDQMVRIAAAAPGPARVQALRRTLGRSEAELAVKTFDEAHERFYATRKNSATLEAYARMLQRLVKGELLSPRSTAHLFSDMKLGNFTNYRLQAGLPRAVPFIHKTGTQHRRACHVGVLQPQDGGRDAFVVAACTAGADEHRDGAAILERVGRALSATVVPALPAAPVPRRSRRGGT